MMPPICAVCHTDFDPFGDDAGTVRFANYEPLPRGMVGHPKGLVWFCERHYAAAQALTHLTSTEAIRQIESGGTVGSPAR